MDRGRVIDKTQNENARFIDNFGSSNKTSVKTTNPPGKIISNKGGKSSFSLGWSTPEENTKSYETKNNVIIFITQNSKFSNNNNFQKYEEPKQQEKTNVRVIII